MTTTEASDGIPFVAVLCVEGYQTGDGRYLEPGTGSWRQLPQPLMVQTVNGDGHTGSVIGARIDTIRMDGRRMMAEGVFDNGPDGQEFARLVHDQMLRFVSIDMADADVTIEPIAYDDEGFPTETLARFGPYQIMGATVTAHPAIDLAVIWLKSDPAPAEAYAQLPEPLGPPVPMPEMDSILLASAEPTLALIASGEVHPPRAWFEMPEPDELTAVEITDQGQFYGHVAPWDCCHIGFLNRCVEPPRGCDYDRNYHLGIVVTTEGDKIATGPLTIGGGHADERLSAAAALARYDDAAIGGANIRVTEGKYGLWACGAIRPGTSDEQIAMMRASAPSGDWRPLGGKLELVNVHYVNTPGFPVPRLQARVASGELVGLTASIGHEDVRAVASHFETGYVQGIVEGIESAVPDVEAAVAEVARQIAGPTESNIPDDDPAPVLPTDPPEPTVDDRLARIEHAISPLLETQRDEILARHPAPPEPSPLEAYLASRENTEPSG